MICASTAKTPKKRTVFILVVEILLPFYEMYNNCDPMSLYTLHKKATLHSAAILSEVECTQDFRVFAIQLFFFLVCSVQSDVEKVKSNY